MLLELASRRGAHPGLAASRPEERSTGDEGSESKVHSVKTRLGRSFVIIWIGLFLSYLLITVLVIPCFTKPFCSVTVVALVLPASTASFSRGFNDVRFKP